MSDLERAGSMPGEEGALVRYPDSLAAGAGQLGLAGAEIEGVGTAQAPQSTAGSAESPLSPRVEATTRLIAVARGIYDDMIATGAFHNLSPGDQKLVRKLAREEEPRDFVGAEVEALRAEAGLTQKVLASRVDVSITTALRFFQGTTHPATLVVASMLYEVNGELLRQGREGVAVESYKDMLIKYQAERFRKRHHREPSDEEIRGFSEQAEHFADRYPA
jgi:transcriptional regulator with XRE-family HTH domain